MRLIAAFAAVLALCPPAWAEIEKIATPGANGFRLHWWPKVTVPRDWHHERDQSMSNGFNAMAPDGSHFADAESVMYASALYKPREPKLKTLQALIESDRSNFLGERPDPGR